MRLGDVFTDADVARLYRHRPPYPQAVVDLLQRLTVEPRVVLDAGAGPGALARRMVSFAERVDAVDPSAAMIDAGRQLPGGDDPRIRWIVGRAEDAPLSPPYGLITCGASLHWMDLDVVLPRFGAALAPDAVVAVVDTENVHGPYRDDVLEIIKAHSEVEHHKGPRELVDDMRASGHFIIEDEEWTKPESFVQSIDEYIEFLHSTSTLARVRLAERSAAFDEKIRAIFARHGIERLRYDVVGFIAWARPA